jgi:hypothetical protein
LRRRWLLDHLWLIVLRCDRLRMRRLWRIWFARRIHRLKLLLSARRRRLHILSRLLLSMRGVRWLRLERLLWHVRWEGCCGGWSEVWRGRI